MGRFLPFAIWAVLTVGLLVGSSFGFMNWAHYRSHSVPGEGKVTWAADEFNSHTRERQRRATIEWQDGAGVVRSFTLYDGYQRGETVKFRYDPERPDEPQSGAGLWVGLILGTMGVVFLGLFIKVLRGGGAKRPAAATPSS